MSKLLKGMVGLVIAFGVVGCGTMEGMVKPSVDNSYKLAKDGSGVTYGLVTDVLTDEQTKRVCGAINNADSRCQEPGYKAIAVSHAFGYAAAGAWTFAMVPSSTYFKPCVTGGGSGCSYVKVRSDKDKLATVLDTFVESNGCSWKGMAKMGGVVCNGWDYRKDMRDWDTTNGKMAVMDK